MNPTSHIRRFAVLYFIIIEALQRTQSQTTFDFQCNFYGDVCPFQLDGECDDQSVNSTASVFRDCLNGGDCVDCDPCGAYHFTNCSTCVSHGCVWCPGNAFCSSEPLGQKYFNRFGEGVLFISCEAEDKWVSNSTTCDAPVEVDIETGNTNTSDNHNNTNRSNDTKYYSNVFTDPLYDSMKWSFELLNVESVWQQGIFGEGIHIRVNDEGVDGDHIEFNEKFSVEGSCEEYWNDQISNDHGTAAASIAAATANNGECSAGIAPNAIVSSCNLFANDDIPDIFSYALTDSSLDGNVDISSNSWGPQICLNKIYSRRRRQRQRHRHLQAQQAPACPFKWEEDATNRAESPCKRCDFVAFEKQSATLTTECLQQISEYCAKHFKEDEYACAEFLNLFVECEYHSMEQMHDTSLREGITKGRNGLGIVYLFASGNEYHLGSDVNFDGWLNSRYTISVGAVGRNGKHADYSTPGAANFCSAPGGDHEYVSNNIVAKPGGGCHDISVGSSFACPAAAGVVALMLEVNPSLSWRDVQGIIAQTSYIMLDKGEEINTHNTSSSSSWTINAASFHHSYLYGFGLVDAAAAVEASKTWKSWGQEEALTASSGNINLPIADEGNVTVTSSVPVTWSSSSQNAEATFFVESVIVHLELEHPSRGDLDVRLISPQGTESILHPGKRPESKVIFEEWELMTVRAWGEDPVGEWTLSIMDQRVGDLTDCVDKSYSLPVGNTNLTCALTVLNDFCRDGNLYEPLLLEMPDTSNGNTADMACCVCGGGQEASEVRDLLLSWDITVYGHVVIPVAPTTAPTTSPTTVPTNGGGQHHENVFSNYRDQGKQENGTPTTASENIVDIETVFLFAVFSDDINDATETDDALSALEETYKLFITKITEHVGNYQVDTEEWKRRMTLSKQNEIRKIQEVVMEVDGIMLYDIMTPCPENITAGNEGVTPTTNANCHIIIARYNILLTLDEDDDEEEIEYNSTNIESVYYKRYSSRTEVGVLGGYYNNGDKSRLSKLLSEAKPELNFLITRVSEPLLFVISTSFVVTSNESVTETDLDVVNEAFQRVVSEMVQKLVTGQQERQRNLEEQQQQEHPQSRRRRRRELQVTLITNDNNNDYDNDGGPMIHSVTPCTHSTFSYCQSAEARYTISVTRDDIDDDLVEVYERLSTSTQTAIEDGSLKEAVLETDSESHHLFIWPNMTGPTGGGTTGNAEKEDLVEDGGGTGGENNTEPPTEDTNNNNDTGGKSEDWYWFWIPAALVGGILLGVLLQWICFLRSKRQDFDKPIYEDTSLDTLTKDIPDTSLNKEIPVDKDTPSNNHAPGGAATTNMDKKSRNARTNTSDTFQTEASNLSKKKKVKFRKHPQDSYGVDDHLYDSNGGDYDYYVEEQNDQERQSYVVRDDYYSQTGNAYNQADDVYNQADNVYNQADDVYNQGDDIYKYDQGEDDYYYYDDRRRRRQSSAIRGNNHDSYGVDDHLYGGGTII